MGNPHQDIHPPKIDEAKKSVRKHHNSELDKALENTFPASDPVSATEPHRHLGSGKKQGHAENSPSGPKETGKPKN